ncbi:MAG: transposase family protein, partial [Coleofasciculus sp. B1-GNL1-01]|uniref:transposase family protein n=1 Tax=Coleofasciculus sp. B1-GNL1-01 TaxID=3068484 RepID=UPI0032F8BD47
LLVIMGTLSDCLGYRALEDFCRRHHDALVTSLQLPPTRFPSDSTFRRMMMGIDFADLAKIFNSRVYTAFLSLVRYSSNNE